MAGPEPQDGAAERRLAAIMFADVAGFSALMERSESTTFARLRRVREEICGPLVGSHAGRLVKNTGDGFLAEFRSASAAVRCAVQIQQETMQVEAPNAPADRIRFRIGINVGDVIVDGDDLAGDGVNIAARLESLSPVDGVCISSAVHDQLRDDVGVRFTSRGEQRLKNISRPLLVYTTSLAPPDGAVGASAPAPLAHQPLRRLSVLVLPFKNAGGDASLDYLVDAITDDITNQLSLIKESWVVGRDTAFAFRGRERDIAALGHELGVRYVLQGALEIYDESLDVDVHLIDCLSGTRLWADHIEVDRRAARNIRREVVARLAVALNLQLVRAEAQRSLHENPDHPDAVDLVMRAWAVRHSDITPQALERARGLFAQALQVQPDYQPAMAGMAELLALKALSWPGTHGATGMREAEQYATQAVRLDPQDAVARYALARVHLQLGRLAAALAENDQALELNPNLIAARAFSGLLMVRNATPEFTVERIKRALALSPMDPARWSWMAWAGHALVNLGQHHDATIWLEKAVSLEPRGFWPLSNLFVAHAAMDNKVRAGEVRARLFELRPDYSIALVRQLLASTNEAYLRMIERQYIAVLRAAGVPEGEPPAMQGPDATP
jgi:class 3 adenylate cyclase/TolB-like protein